MYAREKKVNFANCAYYLPACQEIYDSSWQNYIYWELKMEGI